MKRTSSQTAVRAPGYAEREKEKFLATRHGPDQFKHLDKVLSNLGDKHGEELLNKPLYERFAGAKGNKVSRKPSNFVFRVLQRLTKHDESVQLGTNYYAAAMGMATSQQPPHVQQAADEFMAMVTRQNGELLFTPELANLVYILGNPEATRPQQHAPAPAATTVQAPVETPQASETPAQDPYEQAEEQLLKKCKLSPSQESLVNMHDYARVASVVDHLENQSVAYRLAHGGRDITATDAAAYILKHLAPVDSPTHVQDLGKLLNDSPLVHMVHPPVAQALIEHYVVSAKSAWEKASNDFDELSAEIDKQ